MFRQLLPPTSLHAAEPLSATAPLAGWNVETF
jgi:hypothetical protein